MKARRETRAQFMARREAEREALALAKHAAARGITVEEYVARHEALVMEPTLSEVLISLGYTTAPAPGMYAKHVLRGAEIVFTGRADECWAWLAKTGQHPAAVERAS